MIVMFKIWSRMKAPFKRYLDRLSAANQKEFGGSVPDCCKINQQNQKNGKS